MMSTAREAADDFEQYFIYSQESNDVTLSNLCVILEEDDPICIPSQVPFPQNSSPEVFNHSLEVPYYHDLALKIEHVDDHIFDPPPQLLSSESLDEDEKENQTSSNVIDSSLSSSQSRTVSQEINWISSSSQPNDSQQLYVGLISSRGHDQLISGSEPSSSFEVQSHSLSSQNNHLYPSRPFCCRKHEKYFAKLSSRSSGRKLLSTRIGEIAVEKLYQPLNFRFIKPKYSHNILCAFAIWSNPNQMIEVSEIYRFLSECFPYFETAELHWKNSLRHSLATCDWFLKSDYHRTEKKGYKWILNEARMDCLQFEIRKQCIRDITRLYHCLSSERVCNLLFNMGLVDFDVPSVSSQSDFRGC